MSMLEATWQRIQFPSDGKQRTVATVRPRSVMQFWARHQQERQTWSSKFSFTGTTISEVYQKKGKVTGGTSPSGTARSFRVLGIWNANVRIRHAIVGICPNVSSTKRMKVAIVRKSVRFVIQTMKRHDKTFAIVRSNFILSCVFHRTSKCESKRLDLRTWDGPSWRRIEMILGWPQWHTLTFWRASTRRHETCLPKRRKEGCGCSHVEKTSQKFVCELCWRFAKYKAEFHFVTQLRSMKRRKVD